MGQPRSWAGLHLEGHGMQQQTKDLTLEWVRHAPAALSQSALSVDAKLIGILAASSVLIGVVVSLASNTGTEVFSGYGLCVFVVAALTYISIVTGTLIVVRPTAFEDADDPHKASDYWPHPPAHAREIRWGVIRRAYSYNRSQLERKTAWLKWSIGLLGIETVSLVVWTILLAIRPPVP